MSELVPAGSSASAPHGGCVCAHRGVWDDFTASRNIKKPVLQRQHVPSDGMFVWVLACAVSTVSVHFLWHEMTAIWGFSVAIGHY